MLNLSPKTGQAATAHILIGSNDPTVLNDSTALDPHQFQLIPIKTSHEALLFVEKSSVELIVLDLDSLGPDGLLAAMIIRHRDPTRHIPMILLSSQEKLPIYAIDGCSGCLDFVAKPYDREVLLWKIESFLRMRTYLRQIKSFPDEPDLVRGSARPNLVPEPVNNHIESFINYNSSALSSQLAACIAHEIKNPLTTMQAMLEIAKLSQRPLQPDKIEILLEELQHISNIVNNSMAISKNQRASRTVHHLEQIIQNMKPILEAKSALEKKKIVYELNPCPPILVNHQDIVQLILNLALNGLEAMAQQGTNLFITTEFQNGSVLLHVSDEGPGIPPEIQQKIWEPFYTTKPSGSGLGLVICRALAERNDAEISISSACCGATFTVKFQPHAD